PGSVGRGGAIVTEALLQLLARLAQRGLGFPELASLEPRPAAPEVQRADGRLRAEAASRAHRLLPHAQRVVVIGQSEYRAGDGGAEARVAGDQRPIGEDS